MNTQMSEALAQMRLPPHRISSMIQEAANATGDETLITRLRLDRHYHEQAAYMTQSLVLGFTLAQTMREDVDFDAMFKGAQLAEGDIGLAKLGKQMIEWMVQEPVAQDADIGRPLFDQRTKVIAAAI